MRHLILVAALASTVASASFWEKAQGYLSGAATSGVSANASVAAGASGSSSNWLSGLQNSSFGQAVAGGIDFYNNVKNGNGTDQLQAAFNNSTLGGYYQAGAAHFNNTKNGNGSFIDTDYIQKAIANSTFGEVVQSGVDFFNNVKSGNKYGGNASDIMDNFVPFLANASTEAKAEFYAILPNVPNMTIAQFEAAVSAWAAKYGLTAEVDAFNERAKNITVAAEDHANSIVMNLPNVLNNLKAISSDKNQTVEEMHTRIINYVVSLDDDTRDIVVVLFSSMLPPQFKQVKCTGGNFISDFYNTASNFFGGGNGQKNSTSNFNFGSFSNFFGGNGNGNNNGNGGNGGNGPNFGIIANFMNKNNLTTGDVNNVLGDAQADGMAAIQILPMPQIKVAGEVSADTETKKNTKKQQQAANKKKKTTTVAPELAVNLGAEVHAQVL